MHLGLIPTRSFKSLDLYDILRCGFSRHPRQLYLSTIGAHIFSFERLEEHRRLFQLISGPRDMVAEPGRVVRLTPPGAAFSYLRSASTSKLLPPLADLRRVDQE